MRSFVILAVCAGLALAVLTGCDAPPASAPAVPPSTKIDAGTQKMGKTGEAVSAVAGQPGVNPSYSGGLGSKVK